jgi:mannose/fructose-specific phosphotransferase system component IIA
VDSREHYADFVVEKFKDVGVEAEIACLPHNSGCDYIIANTHGSCAIQRKDSMAEICGNPVQDKYKSAMEELRYEIIPNLVQFSDNPVLLVEESHEIGEKGYLFRKQDRLWKETSMHSSSYYGFLETVRLMGCDVVCTRNLEQSIWWMISMHGFLGKRHYPKHQKFYGPEQSAMGMLCCVPTIGEKRAEKILSKHSISDLIFDKNVKEATEKQKQRIEECLRWKAN